jgi:hypothetical protein
LTMKIKTILLLAVGGFFLTPVISFAQQNFEIGGYVGGQINGGVDLSTTLFHRIEVQNGTNYGITAGYLLGEQHWLLGTDGRLRVSDPDHVTTFRRKPLLRRTGPIPRVISSEPERDLHIDLHRDGLPVSHRRLKPPGTHGFDCCLIQPHPQ